MCSVPVCGAAGYSPLESGHRSSPPDTRAPVSARAGKISELTRVSKIDSEIPAGTRVSVSGQAMSSLLGVVDQSVNSENPVCADTLLTYFWKSK